jgi:hypothetical protein
MFCKANDLSGSVQFSYLMSSTTYGGDTHHIIGRGAYMYEKNTRRTLALFSVRALVKSTWHNSNNVYIGR